MYGPQDSITGHADIRTSRPSHQNPDKMPSHSNKCIDIGDLVYI